jgi:hypothetical protein
LLILIFTCSQAISQTKLELNENELHIEVQTSVNKVIFNKGTGKIEKVFGHDSTLIYDASKDSIRRNPSWNDSVIQRTWRIPAMDSEFSSPEIVKIKKEDTLVTIMVVRQSGDSIQKNGYTSTETYRIHEDGRILMETEILPFGYFVRQQNQKIYTEIPDPVIVAPGKNGQPPSDAIILFDQDTLINFVSIVDGEAPAWKVSGKKFTVEPGTNNIMTRERFGDCQLHIEWKTSRKDVEAGKTGQQCSNSGVYFMSKYEIQVLNSFENETHPLGQAGAFYDNFPPLVNASREPGEWQVYDIIFIAPIFNENEELLKPGFFTVFHNGVLIQNHVEITAPTASHFEEFSLSEKELPLMLQDHKNKVSYRNIWIRRL